MGNANITKQLLVERRDTEKRIKKAIENSEKKCDKKVQRVESLLEEHVSKLTN